MADDETAQLRMPDAVIADALAGIFDDLGALPATPKTRELQARATSYRRVFESWGHTRPTMPQRLALRDLILDLHAKLQELRNEADMAATPVVGVPAMRDPNAPPSRRR
jgi:hypothetical protein